METSGAIGDFFIIEQFVYHLRGQPSTAYQTPRTRTPCGDGSWQVHLLRRPGQVTRTPIRREAVFELTDGAEIAGLKTERPYLQRGRAF